MWIDSIAGTAFAVMTGALALDAAWCRVSGRRDYGARQTAASLACFLSAKALTFGFLALAPSVEALGGEVSRAAGAPAWKWAACLLGADFLYYWWHRSLHRVNALWALHIVHHQSDEFNLATGMRTGWFTQPTLALFYAPLLLAGFEPAMVLACASAIGLYQFALHTRHVGRLGALDRILCTPSNHRVHHGSDREYAGRNFGGILIVWDRLFGTFAEEGREPSYGVPGARPTLNVVVLNFSYLMSLARGSRGLSAREALRLWAGSPFARPPS